MKQKWSIHCCGLDKYCRDYAGRLWRLHVNSPWWHLGIALTPGTRYATSEKDDWISFHKYTS